VDGSKQAAHTTNSYNGPGEIDRLLGDDAVALQHKEARRTGGVCSARKATCRSGYSAGSLTSFTRTSPPFPRLYQRIGAHPYRKVASNSIHGRIGRRLVSLRGTRLQSIYRHEGFLAEGVMRCDRWRRPGSACTEAPGFDMAAGAATEWFAQHLHP
jgi:hypothetical protein